MAASITLASTTAEGQIFELANGLQALEYAQPEASRPNRVSVTVDTEGKSIAIAVTLDATLTPTGSDLKISPVPYLP